MLPCCCQQHGTWIPCERDQWWGGAELAHLRWSFVHVSSSVHPCVVVVIRQLWLPCRQWRHGPCISCEKEEGERNHVTHLNTVDSDNTCHRHCLDDVAHMPHCRRRLSIGLVKWCCPGGPSLSCVSVRWVGKTVGWGVLTVES